jgi:hypothetical protein
MADIGAVAYSPSIEAVALLKSAADTRLDRGSTVFSTESSSLKTQEILGGGGSTAVTYYRMRAFESGGGCGSPTPRYWSVPNTPDTLGTLYPGPFCSPAGTLTDIIIIAIQRS